MDKKQELKIELAPEIAGGHYSNLALIAHSANEFFLDFICVAPNMPQARVQSRIVMSPENAKTLLFALRDNSAKLLWLPQLLRVAYPILSKRNSRVRP